MNIVLALDSFKGSASSQELALHVSRGIKKVKADAKITSVAVADGGEGTVEALAGNEGAVMMSCECFSPMGKKVQAAYTLLADGTAVIEMAAASGLPLVLPNERDPWLASSYGTGELILDAMNKGARKFIIGIGGSATNDMGMGMLRALGFEFYDTNKQLLTCTKDLPKIAKIKAENVPFILQECEFLVACDVNNPLFGPNGASYIYGPQKGADAWTVKAMDMAHRSFAKVVCTFVGSDYSKEAGVGAAGGLGFALKAFLNATLKSGIKIILEQQNFAKKIDDADLVITGEGRIDVQSTMGKVLDGIGAYCKEKSIPCIALAGGCQEYAHDIHKKGISAIFSIMDAPMSLEKAMEKETALHLIEKKSEQILRLINAFE